ncbi:hypothetical protein [Kaarinaea lacus]
MSNAADGRVQKNERSNHNVQRLAPGTLGTLTAEKKPLHLPLQGLPDDKDDNSCELKT